MKQLLFGLAIVAVIFSASLVNSVYVEMKVSEIQSVLIYDDDESVNEALKRWKKLEGYASIMLRQDAIYSVTDAFYEYLGAVYDADENVSSAKEKLMYHLNSITEMEKLSFGSVF